MAARLPRTSARRTVAGTLGLLLVAASLAFAAAPASATTQDLTGGTFTWGVKESFRTYLTTPPADGTFTVFEGTQASGNGPFTFPLWGGRFDSATASAAAEVKGGLQVVGHEGLLDISVASIKVEITGTTGTIQLDAWSRPYTGSETEPQPKVFYDDVIFATLDLSATTPAVTSKTVTYSSVPTTLTAAGVPVLEGLYPAGTALDPITLTGNLAQPPSCTPAKPVITAATSTSFSVTHGTGACDKFTIPSVHVWVYEAGTTTVVDDVETFWTANNEFTGLDPGKAYTVRTAGNNGIGFGPKSPGTVVAPPFSTLDGLTTRQYQDFRGRVPTTLEKGVWSTEITAGRMTPVQAVDQAVDFPEWAKQSPVIRLFQAYFLRLPDTGGLNYWTGKSRAGTRINTISASFATSSEFTNKYGKLTNKKFVELVYTNVLGRPGDPGGIASWTGKLDAKTKTRGEVMVGFSESNEYKTKTRALTDVVNTYTGMLRRTPTKAESATWEPQLRAGTPRATLITALYGSAAYDARAS